MDFRGEFSRWYNLLGNIVGAVSVISLTQRAFHRGPTAALQTFVDYYRAYIHPVADLLLAWVPLQLPNWYKDLFILSLILFSLSGRVFIPAFLKRTPSQSAHANTPTEMPQQEKAERSPSTRELFRSLPIFAKLRVIAVAVAGAIAVGFGMLLGLTMMLLVTVVGLAVSVVTTVLSSALLLGLLEPIRVALIKVPPGEGAGQLSALKKRYFKTLVFFTLAVCATLLLSAGAP